MSKVMTASEMGVKGGRARARKLTAKQRSDSCRHAARCRWGKKPRARTKRAS